MPAACLGPSRSIHWRLRSCGTLFSSFALDAFIACSNSSMGGVPCVIFERCWVGVLTAQGLQNASLDWPRSGQCACMQLPWSHVCSTIRAVHQLVLCRLGMAPAKLKSNSRKKVLACRQLQLCLGHPWSRSSYDIVRVVEDTGKADDFLGYVELNFDQIHIG